MLLETLDIKKNDVIIFSQNIFDLEKNFKIIYKDDPKKEPRKINYSEVCRFVNEYTPKNLIIYRLLTNIKDFEIYLSKYGFFININGATELIYFDPIYAIKELEDYPEAINYYDLRFRIQQVGLTTLNRKGDLPNFAEIYSIDLEATEAKFQNDKAFAEAIFAFYKVPKVDHKKPKEAKSIKAEPPLRPQPAEQKKAAEAVEAKQDQKPEAEIRSSEGIKIIQHEISEDRNFDYKQIMKMNFKGATGVNENKFKSNSSGTGKSAGDEIKDASKVVPKAIQQNGGNKSLFGKFLQDSQSAKKSKKTGESVTEEKTLQVIDIFKSPSSLNNITKGRENKQVVLKLDKK